MKKNSGRHEWQFMDVDARDDPLLAEYERARDLLRTPDWRQGLTEIERLARAGSMMSVLHLGDAMRWGWGFDQDFSSAALWYQVAVKSGSARGIYGLGLTHLKMGRISDAIQDLEAATARDYPPAYCALGSMYFNGKDIPVDKQRATDLWRKGASLGHLRSKFELMHLALHGYYGFRGRIAAIVKFLPFALEYSIVKVETPYTDRLR